jgi:hypothetical protein
MKPLYQRLGVALLALLSFQVSATTRYVDVNGKNPASPYLGWSTAATNIQDAIDAAVDGDLVLVTNGIYSTGGRVVYGQETNRVALTKTVTLSSMNGPQATMVLGGTQTRGVYVSSNAVLNGFTIVSGRADIPSGDAIQERSGGGVWCEPGGVVSNCIIRNNFALLYGGGIYGGTVYNCTVTTNQSSYGYGGGAAASILYNSTLMSNTVPMGSGGGAYLCLLSNCTLTANYAYSSGGGVGRSTNYNCVLSGNSNFYHDSGGADHGILYNCVLTRNTGGANYCTLYNCTVVNNSAYIVGGAYYCTAYNSIIYFNAGSSSPNWSGGTFNHCCTTPFLNNNGGNITNDPAFVNPASGDYHLQTNSPCINSGNNTCVSATTDLDGNPRIKGGTVDIGAYEFQSPASVISYAWLQRYSLPLNGTADYADTDHDGMNNWQEWRTGTIPNDPTSLLKMLTSTTDISGTTITWQSVSGMNYFIQRSSTLGAQPPFSTIQTNIVGQAGTTSYLDTTAVGDGPFFYRVGVQ